MELAAKTQEQGQPRNVTTLDGERKVRFRESIRKMYLEEESYRQVVDSAVDNMVKKCAKPLMDLIDAIDSRITLEMERAEGTVINSSIASTLSDSDLDLYCIKLASLGVYVQQQVDRRALDMDIAEHVRNLKVANNLAEKAGADSASRLKIAQKDAEIEEWVWLVKKNAYASLRHLVERSERLYEAIKKVIDRRREELYWNRRS